MILVVDDDPILQMTAARVLEQAPPAVVLADDGARRLARSWAEEAPGTDGFEPIRCLLQQRRDLPIVTMSGQRRMCDSMREPDDPTMATKLGVIHTPPKPFKPAVLLAMAADCLTSSRLDRDAVPNS